MAKDAILQQVTEWYAPAVGVTKLEIGMMGRPIISMALTQLRS